MRKDQRLWTRDELILAINLYCKIPFGRIHNSNPEIIGLGKLLDRSASAVGWKLVNFASLDPTLSQKGADHTSKLDKVVWSEFFNNWEELAWQSEKILAEYQNKKVEDLLDAEDIKQMVGLERDVVVKSRVNQSFFRKTVLASYNSICCITGLSHPNLLIASHIIPWSKNEDHRVNPTNGLCLNSLHDKAFDSGLMTVTPDYKVKISDVLLKQKGEDTEYFALFENRPITLPQKFLPNRDFLEWHNQNVFMDNQ